MTANPHPFAPLAAKDAAASSGDHCTRTRLPLIGAGLDMTDRAPPVGKTHPDRANHPLYTSRIGRAGFDR